MSLLPTLTKEQVRELAERPTPQPAQGVWTLTSPDGKAWDADSPLKCVMAEGNDRIPALVRLARIQRSIDDEGDPEAAVPMVPADVREAAQAFVNDGYRGPLAWAKKVFDWVAAAAPMPAPVAWQPIESAPKDGTLLLLLVEFEEHATEDTIEPSPTIGANVLADTGEDRWHFAGWCWTHDHFTQGVGKPVAWLPIPPADRLLARGGR